ncbi:putative baseplate assembly protein [Cellulosimicrobium terreum]|nr:putative baseplate assembly protein [Cellulosimicrobium terreum]
MSATEAVTESAEVAVFGGTIDREARRSRVRGRADLDGIDFVEVLSNHAGTPGHVPGAPSQRTLVVHLLNGPVPAGWGVGTVALAGGVRDDPDVNPVGVEWAYPAPQVAGTAGTPATDPLDGVEPADRLLVAQGLPDDVGRERGLVVRTTTPGDLSTYTLRLLGPGGTGVPDGIDPVLATATFRFAVDCPSDLDCRVETVVAPPVEALAPGDYLARDYAALRTRLLDRLATLQPGWTDRSPADPAVMVTELFAAVGDRLAAWQDAVAAEAYLGTARRRTSVRRHARLLGYRVHEGCSARTLLALETDTTLTLPVGTPVADLPDDARIVVAPGAVEPTVPVEATDAGRTVFETVAPLTVRPERNALDLYAWGDDDHWLPAGATSAFLRTDAGTDPLLRAGDLLVLVDRPVGADPRDGHPGRRFGVRLTADAVEHGDPLEPGITVWEVRWNPADALPAPLRVSEPGTEAARAAALANVVVADHGATVPDEALVPPTVGAGLAYRPRLQRPGLSRVDPVLAPSSSVTALLAPDPRRAAAALALDDGLRTWTPRDDMLGSGRLATHLVVEPEPGGVSRLRFGAQGHGRRPVVGATPRATYRVGSGAAGDVGPGRLVRLLLLPGGTDPAGGADLRSWNPLPASGGREPEALEQVRQLAPAAFRTQRRAVTSADHAAVAEQNPGTQRAVARRRWTGSWYAQSVTLDPVASRADDPVLRAEVLAALEVRRMAGVDVALERPLHVPLELVLGGCVADGYLVPDVTAVLREVFTAGVRRDGSPGFFHPDRFTFGQPLRLSDVVGAAMTVDGVSWVELRRFARAGATRAQAAASLRAGVLVMAPRELLRCDSDPNDPEAGHVRVQLGGAS